MQNILLFFLKRCFEEPSPTPTHSSLTTRWQMDTKDSTTKGIPTSAANKKRSKKQRTSSQRSSHHPGDSPHPPPPSPPIWQTAIRDACVAISLHRTLPPSATSAFCLKTQFGIRSTRKQSTRGFCRVGSRFFRHYISHFDIPSFCRLKTTSGFEMKELETENNLLFPDNAKFFVHSFFVPHDVVIVKKSNRKQHLGQFPHTQSAQHKGVNKNEKTGTSATHSSPFPFPFCAASIFGEEAFPQSSRRPAFRLSNGGGLRCKAAAILAWPFLQELSFHQQR